jgi:hypothetical protein
MPGPMLNVSSNVMCMHGGLGTPTVPSPRVSAMGSPVVTLATAYVIAGCSLTSTPPFCATAQFVTAATRVTAGGQPLLLADSQAVCAATGTGVIVLPNQARVTAQ